MDLGRQGRDYGARRELSRLRERFEAQAKAIQRPRRRAARELEALDTDVRFLGLLTRALLDVVIEKDLATMDEVVERMHEVDALDGETGDGLDPSAIAEEMGVEVAERDGEETLAEQNRAERKEAPPIDPEQREALRRRARRRPR